MKRHRTRFPGNVNFSGWWAKAFKSSRGTIARLQKEGFDLREHVVYSLKFDNGQTGNGRYTSEDLLEKEIIIRLNREDFNDDEKPQTKKPQHRSILRR